MSQDSGCRPGMALILGYGTATDICCISCLVHSPHSRHLDTHGDPRLTLTRAFAMSYSQQHAVRSSTVLRGFDSAGAKCHRMRSLQKISEMNLSSPYRGAVLGCVDHEAEGDVQGRALLVLDEARVAANVALLCALAKTRGACVSRASWAVAGAVAKASAHRS